MGVAAASRQRPSGTNAILTAFETRPTLGNRTCYRWSSIADLTCAIRGMTHIISEQVYQRSFSRRRQPTLPTYPSRALWQLVKLDVACVTISQALIDRAILSVVRVSAKALGRRLIW